MRWPCNDRSPTRADRGIDRVAQRRPGSAGVLSEPCKMIQYRLLETSVGRPIPKCVHELTPLVGRSGQSFDRSQIRVDDAIDAIKSCPLGSAGFCNLNKLAHALIECHGGSKSPLVIVCQSRPPKSAAQRRSRTTCIIDRRVSRGSISRRALAVRGRRLRKHWPPLRA
jgi:hypothetical protein